MVFVIPTADTAEIYLNDAILVEIISPYNLLALFLSVEFVLLLASTVG